MSSSQPEFRAPIIRSLLGALEQTPQARDVLDQLAPERLGQIRGAGRASWVPAEWLTDLYGAMMAVSGELGLKAFNRRQTYQMAELPMLGPMIRVAVSTFGDGPGTLFRLLPRAKAATARNVGKQAVQFDASDEHRLRIHWSQLAEPLRQRSWVVGQGAQYMGMLDMGGAEGEVSMDDAGLAGGEVTFEARWEPVVSRFSSSAPPPPPDTRSEAQAELADLSDGLT